MKPLILLLFINILFYSCKQPKHNNELKEMSDSISGKLTIFHAGSMSVPLKKIADEFKVENPKVEVLLEAAGSRECARKIIDLNKECDVMVSADYAVIDDLLIPKFASWNIKFASNEMVIAYNEKSRYSSEINAQNWYNILLKKDVAFGRSDPNSDPCGYRSVLTVKLAEIYYNEKGLIDKILKKDNNYIRPKEVDLLSHLELHTIDYFFIYRSVAEQHNLKYVTLSDSINLKNPELTDFYKTASVEVSGKKPDETTTIYGEPMVYGITMINNTANKVAALAFIKFFLNKEKGMKIIESDGQKSVIPSITKTYDSLTEELKQFAKK
ncbi:MAG: molybdate ABC transporter substrate-binding protein [Bacteroidetes bacterium GWA2_30_7]|nr:MAG: molybdate ABC transporter substrate-binding protein [Bacteroidetes bacterium GWA2_30_7]